MFWLRKKKKVNYDALEVKIRNMNPVQRATIIVMANANLSVLSTFFKRPLAVRPYDFPEELSRALNAINNSIQQSKELFEENKKNSLVDTRFSDCHLAALELISLSLTSVTDERLYNQSRRIWKNLWDSRSYVMKAISWLHYYENKTDTYPIPFASTAGKKPWTDMDYLAMSKTVPTFIKKSDFLKKHKG